MHWRRNIAASLVTAGMCLVGGIVGAPASGATPLPSDSPPGATQPIRNVLDAPYDAAGDGTTSDRAAIQQALDDTAKKGGGTVLLPAGHTFLTGSLTLGSRTTLRIDGTLLQSQNSADYTYTPIRGHDLPATGTCTVGSCVWDHAIYHNLPFVFAGEQHDVRVVGSGTIQMTQAESEASTIHLTAIGLYRVSQYEISGLNVLGAVSYNLSLFTTDDGLVKDLNIIAAAGNIKGFHPNTDGISLQNSQHVRITGNTIRNGDDAIYIWSSYADPRAYVSSLGGQLWWSTAQPQASTDIEIDHNDVQHTPTLAVGFIPWGTGAPDPRTVETSHVRIHNNTLTSLATPARSVYCWCDNPNHGAVPYNNREQTDQSAITDVHFFDNTYTFPGFQGFAATDLKTDYGALGSGTVRNGDFEQLGSVWWSSKGDLSALGDVGATDEAHPEVLRSEEARTALTQMDGWVGYIQPRGTHTAQLYQGLGLRAGAHGVPIDTGFYRFSADVVTGADPVRLYVYNTCTQQTVAEKSVTAQQVRHESLDFHLADDCDDVQVGIDGAGSDQVGDVWAFIDNVAVTNTAAIDNTDPTVTYSGRWDHIANVGTWGGTDAVSFTVGGTATIPFNGSRAVLTAIKDFNLGIMEIYLDGVLAETVDLYAPTKQLSGVVYDTGEIAEGGHTIRIVTTGQRNAASTGFLTDWDALFIGSQDSAVSATR